MVKVEEVSKLQKYQIKCPHCNSVLSFTKLYEKSEYHPDVPFEGQATVWSIICPICKYRVPTRSITDRGYYDWREKC